MDIVNGIVQLLGGLAMFLFGIELMGDGLKNSSGEALKRVLEKVTGNVLLGVLTGALVTAVIQSSTATIVLTVALIGAGVLNLKQAVSIVMGANIGTTITSQIIRLASVESDGSFFLWLFDTDTLAPIALVIGIALIMFFKKKNVKPVGDICVGFGILFVGLNLMTSGVKPLIGTDVFLTFLEYLKNPVIGIIFGLVLTVIVQSSSATVGMLQTVALALIQQDAPVTITFSMAYPIIMGINIGTCITTAMVCSVGTSKDAKRTGIVHIAFNVIGTVLFMIVMSIMEHFKVGGESLWLGTVDSGGIADFQMVFNILTAVVLLPFTGLLVKLSCALIKEDAPTALRHPELHILDEKLYISPAVAVAEATKAVSAMGMIAKANFARGCDQLVDYKQELCKDIDEDEDCLDQFADTSDRFLIGLSKVVESDADDKQVDMLLQTVPNFERIGDYATNLMELGERLNSQNVRFSESAREELNLVFSAVNEIMDITVRAFADNDMVLARTIEPLEEVVDDMVIILRDRHTKRLKAGNCSVDTGLVFMETLTYLERCSDQCSSIAVMMMARYDENILMNHYDYLRELHAGNDENYNNEKNRRREQYIAPLTMIQ